MATAVSPPPCDGSDRMYSRWDEAPAATTSLMARETHSKRHGRSASGTSTPNGTGMSRSPLVSLLAHSTKPSDLLPSLHQHAIEVTGGSATLLFQFNPRNGMLQATSAFGLDELRDRPLAAGAAGRRPSRQRVSAAFAGVHRRRGSADPGPREPAQDADRRSCCLSRQRPTASASSSSVSIRPPRRLTSGPTSSRSLTRSSPRSGCSACA